MTDNDRESEQELRLRTERLSDYWRGYTPPAESNDRRPFQPASPRESQEIIVVILLAMGAALSLQLPKLFGNQLFNGNESLDDAEFYIRNFSLLIAPWLVGYLAWKRRLSIFGWVGAFVPLAVVAVVINLYPFNLTGDTITLAALHLPIVLWLAVGFAHSGGCLPWLEESYARYMEFIRFSGEFIIFFVLIALGGGAVTGLTMGLFMAIDIDLSELIQSWLLPSAPAGAVIIVAWLVDNRQGTVANVAPMLARIFTPLAALALAAFLIAMLWTGRSIAVERDILIVFDLVLVLALGLLLYNVSSRPSQMPPGIFDALTALLLVCVLIADILALTAMLARISDFGFSANKIAALGENLVLMVNLAWAVWLYGGFLLRRVNFIALERWQVAYLPVYSLWAGVVAFAFPPLFGWQ